MKKIFVFLVLVFCSSAAFADCSAGTCANVKVSSMQVASDGNVYIQTDGTETNLNCAPIANVLLKLNTNTVGGKNTYAALLSAQARAKPVDIRIIDNVSPCEVTYVNVY